MADSTTARNGRRMLAALYRLTRGCPGVRIEKEALFAECARERLFTCTDEEFAAYKTRVDEEVAVWRKANPS